MGIQGLLPLLKSIHHHKHIAEFAGQTCVVSSRFISFSLPRSSPPAQSCRRRLRMASPGRIRVRPSARQGRTNYKVRTSIFSISGLTRAEYVRCSRYVEYAMHRVRFLLHHKVTPYLVFDGGPLPAKKGTELERKKCATVSRHLHFMASVANLFLDRLPRKREENLARATALTAQGKHTQARDFYTKCVDVTPEMAYQFIKVGFSTRLSSLSYPLFRP